MSGLTNIQAAAQKPACHEVLSDKDEAPPANTLEEDQFIPVVPDIAVALSNREVLLGGHDRVTAAGMCVWPPILLGTRDNLTLFETYACGREPNEIRLLHVFPANREGLFESENLNQVWPKLAKEAGLDKFNKAGWKLSFATVEDMISVDPHRKLVDWVPLCSSAERELTTVSSSKPDTSIFEEFFDTESGVQTCKIDMSPLVFNEDLQASLRDLVDAESSLKKSIEESMDVSRFTSELESILFRQRNAKNILNLLATGVTREEQLRMRFAFDGTHVAKKAAERLRSLRMPNAVRDLEVSENIRNMFISKMVNRAAELELMTLKSLADEMRRESTSERKLTLLYKGHIECTRKLVERQVTELVEHLKKIRSEPENILEERFLSRLELVKSLRRNEEEVSDLTKFLSVGRIEIAEQIHTSALQDRDTEHDREKGSLKAVIEEYENKLVSLNSEVVKVSADLKELREAQPNQKCCVCSNELEGFSVSRSNGESHSSETCYKRACFLPCMHANVCTTCSEKSWNERPPLCPICRQQLTEKPRVIYL